MHYSSGRQAADVVTGKTLKDVNSSSAKPLEPQSTLKKYAGSQLSQMRTGLKQICEKKSKFSYEQAVQALDYKTRDKA